ncbi:MAG: ribonuclease HI [Planctomycetes bacterium]|nr:ribonuclease HI [Planctomycetota bacterium]
MSELTPITIYVKGACVENPGPGGYAAVLISGERRKEIIGGCRLTTNNRMELWAAIAALEALTWPCHVTVRSDSRYLVDGGNQRQSQRWQVNRDLWDRLRDICEKHEVEFGWVRGHAGDLENERCHLLAQAAARREELPEDTGYETKPAQDSQQLLLFD